MPARGWVMGELYLLWLIATERPTLIGTYETDPQCQEQRRRVSVQAFTGAGGYVCIKSTDLVIDKWRQ